MSPSPMLQYNNRQSYRPDSFHVVYKSITVKAFRPLFVSFSSGTFSKVHAGGWPLPLYRYSSTTINVQLWDSKGRTPCESGTKCGIYGVSAPTFFGRKHILTGLQSAWQLELPMHTEHEFEKYTIMVIMGLQSRSSKSVWAGDEKLICNKLWPQVASTIFWSSQFYICCIHDI